MFIKLLQFDIEICNLALSAIPKSTCTGGRAAPILLPCRNSNCLSEKIIKCKLLQHKNSIESIVLELPRYE